MTNPHPMTQTALNGYTLLFLDVPEGAKGIDLDYCEETRQTFLMYNGRWQEPLPPGNWQLLGLASEIQEQDTPEGMIKYYHLDCKYKDYTPANPDTQMCGMYLPMVDTRAASLLSLVRAQGMDETRTVLLYKK